MGINRQSSTINIQPSATRTRRPSPARSLSCLISSCLVSSRLVLSCLSSASACPATRNQPTRLRHPHAHAHAAHDACLDAASAHFSRHRYEVYLGLSSPIPPPAATDKFCWPDPPWARLHPYYLCNHCLCHPFMLPIVARPCLLPVHHSPSTNIQHPPTSPLSTAVQAQTPPTSPSPQCSES